MADMGKWGLFSRYITRKPYFSHFFNVCLSLIDEETMFLESNFAMNWAYKTYIASRNHDFMRLGTPGKGSYFDIPGTQKFHITGKDS